MTFDFKHTSQQLPECIQKVMSVSLDSGKEVGAVQGGAP